MSSAIATLIDWDFETLSLTQWIDPTGATWLVDYSAPSCIGLVKEVLEHHFLNKIWGTSRGLGTTRTPRRKAYSFDWLRGNQSARIFFTHEGNMLFI